MITIRELINSLDLGSSVAEFDDQLESYFVETLSFRELIEDKKDIVAGDKGTGKTAMFKILQKRYAQTSTLKSVVVLQAFNPKGNPIFQQLVERGALDEGEYIKFWKAFVLSIVGNWLLRYNKPARKSNLAKLDQLLRGLELRSESDSPASIMEKTVAKIGSFFRWKSAELKVATTAEGEFSFTPKVEFKDDPQKEEPNISVEAALSLLNCCLDDLKKKAWVAIDRLDEAFQGYPNIEIPALRALFRAYLDLLDFNNLKLKLFVRRDLFGKIIQGGFVNLTHINAKKIDIIWDEDDLLSLLCKRIRKNEAFISSLLNGKKSDQQIFSVIFPEQVDQGARKPATWTWMMGRIRDGNDIKPPRNLIDLVSIARDAQLRREDREPRQYEVGIPVIESDSLRRALTQLSETRVTDTLLAEAGQFTQTIEKFRRGKAEHSTASLAKLLGIEPTEVPAAVRPLKELGFLEEAGGTYKIPMLYRGGLEITQGKAFEDREASDDDREET